jgi:hypothetical protein
MLYHFSEDGGITRFAPRSATAQRAAGQDWLNDPLVWAISDEFAFLYLFPRDCPRIVAWAVQDTTTTDQAAWLGPHRRIAYVEEAWMERITQTHIYRYDLPGDDFTALEDVGMHVSRAETIPTRVTKLTDLPSRLAENDVFLRTVPSLLPLKPVWDTTLHASGIRLRHAIGFPFTRTHPKLAQ